MHLDELIVIDGTELMSYRPDRPQTEKRRLDDRDVHRQASDFEDWFRQSTANKR